MSKKELKTGQQILNEYFSKLAADPTFGEEFRKAIIELWQEGRLVTKTYLSRRLEEIRNLKIRQS